MSLVSDDLLEALKRAISIPASQPLLTDAGLLAIIDGVVKSRVVPLLESVDQNFFVTSSSITLVASQSLYEIPYRAAGRALRDLKLVDSSGGNKRSLPLIDLEDSHLFTVGAEISGFFFEGDRIRIVPDVPSSVSGTLEVWWRLPPSKLALTASAARVSSVSYGVSEDTVTVDSVPSWATAQVSVDFIQGRSGGRIKAFDETVTNVSGTQLTFAAGDVPTDLVAGDYIAQAGYSPILSGVPDETLDFITSLASRKVAIAIGDFEALKEIDKDISQHDKDLKSLVQPRIEGEPQVIINRSSLVRGNKWGLRRWLGPS